MGFLSPKPAPVVLPPIPKVPPAPVIKETTDDLKEETKAALRRRKGTQATILTGGQGLTQDLPEAQTTSLLGSSGGNTAKKKA